MCPLLQDVFKRSESLPDGVADFKANLERHPCFRSTSHKELVLSIQQLFQDWRNALQVLPAEEEDEPPHSLPPSHTEPTPLEQSTTIATRPAADTRDIRMMTSFVDYLRSVDASFTDRFDHESRQSNKKTNRHKLYLIQHNLDHNCPFRESIPSREHILRYNQIFTRDLLRTEEGFFNALIFVLVLYRAPALYASRGVFNNLATWELFCDKHKAKGANWLCNQAAFGSASPARTMKNVPEFSRQAHRWPEWLALREASGVAITVIDIWDFLRMKENGVRVFPSCGDLTAFVLAADIASAGLIPLPTGEQIGHVIATINRGAKAAMVKMQLIPENASHLETQAASARFYDFCTAKLPLDLKVRRNWNGYQFENGLCKTQRVGWDFEEAYIEI